MTWGRLVVRASLELFCREASIIVSWIISSGCFIMFKELQSDCSGHCWARRFRSQQSWRWTIFNILLQGWPIRWVLRALVPVNCMPLALTGKLLLRWTVFDITEVTFRAAICIVSVCQSCHQPMVGRLVKLHYACAVTVVGI